MTRSEPSTDVDPELRRETPLATKLKARIAREGSISIDAYMHACLYDEELGYYTRRPAIGASADFITAPEVSQVFGELIGLWSAVVWRQMGAPASFALIELGPGRGTLMADALRAAGIVPGFHDAARVEMIETNAALIPMQQAALRSAGVPTTWCSRLSSRAAAQPGIVIGNEFLDTVPVAQAVLTSHGWCERRVVVDADGRLAFAAGSRVSPPVLAAMTEFEIGAIAEHRHEMSILDDLASLARQAQLAVLLIDYGHVAPALGDTLQAVRNHRFEHPLASPGEADVTAQVDFHDVAERARALGLNVDGPVTQAQFLGALGLTERTSRLMAANPALAGVVEAGSARLVSPTGMGSRFKVIGLRSSGIPSLPGFPTLAG